ncbi:thioredoxin-like protein [Irpex rosettiformis]|uniref:Thioredoxin-like protein n=1 Tax=Irpex rosettiformis TaxID=378272 RepID=A0ACB8TPB9_9APHY|nr:thioredoxin-like protein [Irpex rosettiformis]
MFSAFKLSRPQISIFHSPSSPPSVAALNLLRSALSGPYPPNTKSQPLSFNLEVIEDKPPTPDQLRTISGYLPSASPDFFISSHPTVDTRPTSADAVNKLAAKNPKALKWPIVVDWSSGRAAVGDVEGVKRILEELRKQENSKAWVR